MAPQPAALLCVVVVLTVSVAVAGRALHEVPPPASDTPAAAAFFQSPPSPALAAFFRPPPSPAAAPGLQTPPPPPVPAATSAILQQPPADQQQGPAAAPYYYYIHVTRVGLLCVLVSFFAGCLLCALFIVCVSRSTRAATRPEDVEEGASVENTALQCLSCLTRVAAGV
ncbi:hypothetical protein ZWY2020_000447 [Hordeum vulgare]|nr:hypothetical protein ZWY2020_000447 [Hordeum vulgare]